MVDRALLTDSPLDQENITGLLLAWNRGDSSALERLTPIVYDELYRLARLRMMQERPDHVLQPSALVNEVFVRMLGAAKLEWANRNQFFAFSARMMRQILIDLARSHQRLKRGSGRAHLDAATLKSLAEPAPSVPREDLLAIDAALDWLQAVDPRRAKVVELRFYGGLDIADIAGILGVSEPTVIRDWRVARASLLSFFNHAPDAQ